MIYVLQNFGEALKHRMGHSTLAACWQTEISPLNQVVHVWGYDSIAERNRIPPGETLVTHQENQIMLAAPFSPIR